MSAFTPFLGWLQGTPDFEVIYLGECHRKRRGLQSLDFEKMKSYVEGPESLQYPRYRTFCRVKAFFFPGFYQLLEMNLST